MVKGIGIDTVSINRTKHLIECAGNSYVSSVYTEAEIMEANSRHCYEEYLSSRFAVKEAAFKAIAPLISDKTFDLRLIETLSRTDGSPYINIREKLSDILEEAQIKMLLVSITTEEDYASAIVIAI